jgi:hypothetical protein
MPATSRHVAGGLAAFALAFLLQGCARQAIPVVPAVRAVVDPRQGQGKERADQDKAECYRLAQPEHARASEPGPGVPAGTVAAVAAHGAALGAVVAGPGGRARGAAVGAVAGGVVAGAIATELADAWARPADLCPEGTWRPPRSTAHRELARYSGPPARIGRPRRSRQWSRNGSP